MEEYKQQKKTLLVYVECYCCCLKVLTKQKKEYISLNLLLKH